QRRRRLLRGARRGEGDGARGPQRRPRRAPRSGAQHGGAHHQGAVPAVTDADAATVGRLAWAKPTAVALGAGLAGGAAFAAAGAPMPWILGAMTANIAAAMSGVETRVPAALVAVMIAVL